MSTERCSDCGTALREVNDSGGEPLCLGCYQRRNGGPENESGTPTGGVPRNRATVQQRTVASAPRILDRFARGRPKAGLVGEERAAKLLYLVLTSRVLDRPISAVVKAP